MTEGRGRLAFAAGATAILTAAIVVVVISGSSGEEGARRPLPGDLERRPDRPLRRRPRLRGARLQRDPLDARRSAGRGGRGRPDRQPTAEARCAVVFASPQVDSEPDFGVRVFDDGRWVGLALVDRVPLEQIETLQADATATANVTLLPDGRLAGTE